MEGGRRLHPAVATASINDLMMSYHDDRWAAETRRPNKLSLYIQTGQPTSISHPCGCPYRQVCHEGVLDLSFDTAALDLIPALLWETHHRVAAMDSITTETPCWPGESKRTREGVQSRPRFDSEDIFDAGPPDLVENQKLPTGLIEFETPDVCYANRISEITPFIWHQ